MKCIFRAPTAATARLPRRRSWPSSTYMVVCKKYIYIHTHTYTLPCEGRGPPQLEGGAHQQPHAGDGRL